jgi:hypothetical protein
MAEELLNRSDVVSIEQKVGREAVTKRVAGGVLGDPGISYRVVEGPLYASLVHVVAAFLSRFPIRIEGRRRKDELPVPLRGCIDVLPRQSVG